MEHYLDVPQDPRPSKAQMWLKVAQSLSIRSHDNQTKVGAVIVSSDGETVLGSGYNGNYAGGPNMRDNPDAAESGQSGLIHAEINALVGRGKAIRVAERLGITEAALFVNYSPCLQCANTIIATGLITEVYFLYWYRNRQGYPQFAGVNLLREAGIECYMESLTVLRDADLT